MNFIACTELELWEYVASHLAQSGIRTVLVGGAVAAIYSEGAYKSGDLDLVIENYSPLDSEIAKSMNDIGFVKQGRHWIHPECNHLFVEFVLSPVAIGDDYRINPDVKLKNGQQIKILSPTDCVRDRLCSYVYFKARECFDQAFLVARRNEIDTASLKKWSRSEGKEMISAVNDLLNRIES
jgi:hypothetical protein